MVTQSKQIELKHQQIYTIPEILYASSECHINSEAEPSLIKECSQLKAILKKSYSFDNMVAKVYNVAALEVVDKKIPIHWSNSCADSLNQISSKELKDSYNNTCNFRGMVAWMFDEGAETILFRLNSIYEGRINNSLDDLYNKIPHEFAHLAMYVSQKKGTTYPTPYRNEAQEKLFNQKSKEVFQKISKDMTNNKGTGNPDELCNNYDSYSAKLKKLLVNNYLDKPKFSAYLTKAEELNTIKRAICNDTPLLLKDSELAVRPFEQIANGLDSDMGCKHNDLQYLQPLVAYAKEVLYPIFDDYIAAKCDSSSSYICSFDKNGELEYLTYLQPNPEIPAVCPEDSY